MPMSPRLLRPRASGVHPEAAAWRSAVVANGGSVSASTMQAVNQFCVSVDRQGLRSKLVRVNLMCGSNLNAVLVPLFRATSRTGTPLGNATDTNTGNATAFVSADYAENSGLASNGSKWLLTGLTQTYADNKHAGAFVHTLSGGIFRTMVGSQDSDTPGVGPAGAFLVGSATSSTVPRMGVSPSSASNATFVNGTSMANGDFVLGSSAASGANQARIFVNGTSQGTGTARDNSFSNGQFAVFVNRRESGGVISEWFSGRLGGYTIGLNLTDAEVATYSTIWDTFLKALGRR